jgi:hypothetical protein
MNWRRAVGYGILLWFAPFALSFAMFGLREGNRALFESLIVVVGVGAAVAAALLYFRDAARPGASAGLLLGLLWAFVSIAIDLPIFLFIFHMPFVEYAADIALTYLAFPLITLGVALGGGRSAT